MTLTYLYIFLQSNLLEVPFYYFFLRKESKFFEALTLVSAINSLTHPIVFFVIMNFELTYLQNILIAEAFAVLAECLYFYKVSKLGFKKSFIAALIANLASWQLAPMITYLVFK